MMSDGTETRSQNPVACPNKSKWFPEAVLVMHRHEFYYVLDIAPISNQLLASSKKSFPEPE